MSSQLWTLLTAHQGFEPFRANIFVIVTYSWTTCVRRSLSSVSLSKFVKFWRNRTTLSVDMTIDFVASINVVAIWILDVWTDYQVRRLNRIIVINKIMNVVCIRLIKFQDRQRILKLRTYSTIEFIKVVLPTLLCLFLILFHFKILYLAPCLMLDLHLNIGMLVKLRFKLKGLLQITWLFTYLTLNGLVQTGILSLQLTRLPRFLMLCHGWSVLRQGLHCFLVDDGKLLSFLFFFDFF